MDIILRGGNFQRASEILKGDRSEIRPHPEVLMRKHLSALEFPDDFERGFLCGPVGPEGPEGIRRGKNPFLFLGRKYTVEKSPVTEFFSGLRSRQVDDIIANERGLSQNILAPSH